jgi:hypothetical protein
MFFHLVFHLLAFQTKLDLFFGLLDLAGFAVERGETMVGEMVGGIDCYGMFKPLLCFFRLVHSFEHLGHFRACVAVVGIELERSGQRR